MSYKTFKDAIGCYFIKTIHTGTSSEFIIVLIRVQVGYKTDHILVNIQVEPFIPWFYVTETRIYRNVSIQH